MTTLSQAIYAVKRQLVNQGQDDLLQKVLCAMEEAREQLDDMRPFITEEASKDDVRFLDWLSRYFRENGSKDVKANSWKRSSFVTLIALGRKGETHITKSQLYQELSTYGRGNEPALKIVDVYVCFLRQVVKGTPLEGQIVTMWGVGYRLTAQGAREFKRLRDLYEAEVAAAVESRLARDKDFEERLWKIAEGAVLSSLQHLNRAEVTESGEVAVYGHLQPNRIGEAVVSALASRGYIRQD